MFNHLEEKKRIHIKTMKTIIKLNNFDLDIPINSKFAEDLRIGDILCVYDFENKKKPDWVILFDSCDNLTVFDENNPFNVLPVDEEYVEEERYFKVVLTDREFRDDELILWVNIYSNDKNSYYDIKR